jgi:hypothetical protein
MRSDRTTIRENRTTFASNRTIAIVAAIGAGALGYCAVRALGRSGERQGSGGALSHGDRFAARDFSSTRSAGPEAMRDPPRNWSGTDQAADESFPASDPPPVGSRVD